MTPTLTALAALGLSLPTAGSAAPIDGFGIGDGPVLALDSLLLAYDEGSDALFVVDFGSTGELDDGEGGTFSIDGTGLNMILSIDGTGRFLSGSLELGGSHRRTRL